MDPYLEEQRWGDFHNRATTYLADALQPGLPGDLRARLGERVYLEWVESPARQYVPDVPVFERPSAARGGGRDSGGTTALAAPPAPVEVSNVASRTLSLLRPNAKMNSARSSMFAAAAGWSR
jgi:hypothetical protein